MVISTIYVNFVVSRRLKNYLKFTCLSKSFTHIKDNDDPLFDAQAKAAQSLITFQPFAISNRVRISLHVILSSANPVSRISRDGEICSEEILDLGGNFGIQEEILTDLKRINSSIYFHLSSKFL